MADHEIPDDPFLETRLSSLALLPVPDRPSVVDLSARTIDVDLSELPGAAANGAHRSHRLWLLTGAAAAVLLLVVSIMAVVRSREAADEVLGPAPVDDEAPDATMEIGTVDPLAGPRWDLVAVVVAGGRTDSEPFEAGRPVWLRFDGNDGQVAQSVDGADKCGDFRGDVVASATTIDFPTPSYVKEVPCNLSLSPVDVALDAIFGSEVTYSIVGTTLTITQGDSSLVLQRGVPGSTVPTLPIGVDPQRFLEVQWQLILVFEGDQATEVPPAGVDGPAYLSFTPNEAFITTGYPPDGTPVLMTGSDGCRSFTGRGLLTPSMFDLDELAYGFERCQDQSPELLAALDSVLFGEPTIASNGSELTLTAGGWTLYLRNKGTPGPGD